MELSDVENKVLVIIKDYLNQNKVFRAKKIVPFIMTRLKAFDVDLNEQGIQKILWKFIREHIVVPGSKLMKETILETNTRKTIFNFIDKNPGTYLREIMDHHDLGSHETLWHLNLLLKFNLIRAKKIGRYKTYFNAKMPEDYDEEMFYLGDPDINLIIQTLVEQNEGMLINHVAEKLGHNFNTVKSNLEKLSQLELVKVSQGGDGQAFYSVNPEKFKEALHGIEAMKTQ
ncbi:MAG: hypothetical protein EU544_01500 [Promethearchaeota archaeon]|nr:MAG: hypothetical protein EU544_01500 [Candidatus Lokiarchaeota archaeon]